MTTPAQISKLTDAAIRAKALMARSGKSGDRAVTVLDNFEQTLNRFDAGISAVDQQEKALAAQLQAMGNAATVIDAAFQDAEAPKAGNGVSAHPTETAALPEVKGG